MNYNKVSLNNNHQHLQEQKMNYQL